MEMRKPCEVISYFKEGKILPVKFRYYCVEKATYYTVQVERIHFIHTRERNGLKERTYHLEGSRKQLKEQYELYLDPRSKTWWVI